MTDSSLLLLLFESLFRPAKDKRPAKCSNSRHGVASSDHSNLHLSINTTTTADNNGEAANDSCRQLAADMGRPAGSSLLLETPVHRLALIGLESAG